MSNLSPDSRAQILAMLDAALKDMRAVRAASNVPAGYVGFEIAEANLLGCYKAVETTFDAAQIAVMLKKLAGALQLTGGGAVWPAVQRTNAALEARWKALELVS